MTLGDDNEAIGLFEPLMVSDSSKHRPALNDLALELAARSEGFQRSLPPSLATAVVGATDQRNWRHNQNANTP